VDFTAALELLLDEKGNAAGAILQNMETGERFVARAKTVVIATGGAGRMHYQGFPTSNHYGATADGLVLGYRAGAKLKYQYTLQYHPTGVAFPPQIYGALVTEKTRGVGALFVNAEGESFVHPLETRDVAAAAVIRECGVRGKGITTPSGGAGLWLDSPIIEIVHGSGTIEKRIPGMMRMFGKYGIDIRKVPMLIYPTLHYQNGGLEINLDGQTTNIKNLYVAGEAIGGIHGENRLMGNSLLDIIVFGRNAGVNASAACKKISAPKGLNFDHVRRFSKEASDASIESGIVSPMLLPDYTRVGR
jgi:succinate dehydrogenase / fumarate reductase flavoprotein subunit